MGDSTLRVLLIDDDEDDYILTRDILNEIALTGRQQIHLDWMQGYWPGREALQHSAYDICLLDYHIGEYNGLQLLQEAASFPLVPPIILLTGHGNEQVDFEAMCSGASDYLVKSQLNAALLERCMRYAIRRKHIEQEREKALQALERRERHFRALIENSNDIILVLKMRDTAAAVAYASPSVHRICGYLPEEIAGEDALGLFFPADREPARRLMYEAAKSPGTSLSLELRIRHKEGLYRWVHSIVTSQEHDPTIAGIVCNLHDITERKVAEEALRNSKARLDGILGALKDVVWSISATDFRLLYLNPAVESVYGRSVSEFFANPALWGEVVHPDDQKAAAEAMADLLTMGTLEQEIRILRPSGEVRWLHDRAVLSRDPATGAPLRIDGISTDITERKKAEAERARLAAIVESSGEAIFGKTLEGIIQTWNRGAERVYGYRAEEIVGRPVSLLAPPEEHGALADILDRINRGERIEDYETVRVRKDGECIHVALSVSPTYDSAGNLVAASTISRDITRQKRAEEEGKHARRALEESEERLRLAVAAGGIGTWDFDLRTGVARCSDTYQRLCGFTEEAPGVHLEDFWGRVDSEDRVRNRRAIEQAKETGGEYSSEYRVRCPDGSQRWLISRGRCLYDEQDNPIRLLGASVDVTGQKRLQEQVVRSERLAAMGELVAGVVHEINNPLAAISGYAQLLEMYSDAQVREDARGILQMSERATRIVLSLLTFARKESAQKRHCLPLRPLIMGILDVLRYKLRKAEVRVEFRSAEPDLCPSINAGEIEQVLMNLISNAEYALRNQEGGKQIMISTEEGQDADGQRQAVIMVRDNGCGIPPDVMPRLFEPFFTTKPTGEGTGLGLAICHGIAQSHGGQLTARSTAGEGTVFILTLPLHETSGIPDVDR